MSYLQSRSSSRFVYKHRTTNRRPATRRAGKEYINPERFIKSAKPVDQEAYQSVHSFDDFAVNPILKRNIVKLGYSQPTSIQDKTIPLGLEGKDVVGIANTGTGKTVAFALPVIDRLMSHQSNRALILAPTRELALQIEAQCRVLATGSGLSGALLIGGVPMGPQLSDLRRYPQIVIGTPGRVKDHLTQGTLKLDGFNVVVLDEVDRMLDMGFINDVQHILGRTADKRQAFFFSATLDNRVKAIIDTYSTDPVHVTVKTGDTSDNVEQNIVKVASKNEKLTKLHDLLIKPTVEKTLVFDDTQRSVEKLCQELIVRGFSADAIHGGKSQSQRQRALKRFKDNQVNVLVATDVAARGIDVADISHVINFSTPRTYDDYIHRIGRAGRAGRSGFALTFIEQY
jgi:superfamily II DNA/RNA helicase